jgi:hypothetical protein
MPERTPSDLPKLPFLLGDLLFVVVAGWLVLRPGPRLDLWHDLLVCGCVAAGAGLGVWPFLREHRARMRLAEANGLASTVEQIRGLTAVGEQVALATGRWQTVQEAAGKTALEARQMADDIAREARQFSEALQKAHDAEIRNLRLEVEKLHRAEGDWLQVLVRIMDHVYALYSAGLRSGQPELSSQLGHFQSACRDTLRRVGLAPLEAAPDTAYDERLHELPPGVTGTPETRVAQTLATGFTYQGQLLRRVLVALAPTDVSTREVAKPPVGVVPADPPATGREQAGHTGGERRNGGQQLALEPLPPSLEV